MTQDLSNTSYMEYEKITPGTVSRKAHKLGLDNGEPLIYGMDGMFRYAQAYEKRFESKLCDDYVLGPHWLEVVKGLRGLLNGDSEVAMRHGTTTDSKDNGAVESIFWAAMNAAGFTEADL